MIWASEPVMVSVWLPDPVTPVVTVSVSVPVPAVTVTVSVSPLTRSSLTLTALAPVKLSGDPAVAVIAVGAVSAGASSGR